MSYKHPVILDAFRNYSTETISNNRTLQHMSIHHVQSDPLPVDDDDKRVHFTSEDDTSRPLVVSEKEQIRVFIGKEISKYRLHSFFTSLSLIAVLVLSTIWIHYLSEFKINEDDIYMCKGVMSLLPHLKIVSILTVIYTIVDIGAILIRNRGALFVIVALMFLTFCYRVIVIIVWLILGDNVSECMVEGEVSVETIGQYEKFGFYLNLVLIIYDFSIKIVNFYLAAKVKSIRDQQELVLQTKSNGITNVYV